MIFDGGEHFLINVSKLSLVSCERGHYIDLVITRIEDLVIAESLFGSHLTLTFDKVR